jgi:hypothetical protein
MKSQLFHYPTPEEMRALNVAAHRNRARCMRVLLRKGVRAGVRTVKSLALRFTAVPVAKRVSHA